MLEVTTEHTEYTEFHRKNTEYRFSYGKHGDTKEVGVADSHTQILSVFSVSEAVFCVFSVKFGVFSVFRGYFKQNQRQSILYSDIFDHIQLETFGAKPDDGIPPG